MRKLSTSAVYNIHFKFEMQCQNNSDLTEVQLYGEEKSGTTLTDYILLLLCREVGKRGSRFKCNERAKGSSQNHSGASVMGRSIGKARVELEYFNSSDHNVKKSILFTTGKHSKHDAPGVRIGAGKNVPYDVLACARTGNLRCLSSFTRNHSLLWDQRAKTYRPFLILRDPRQCAISHCQWRRNVLLKKLPLFDWCLLSKVRRVSQRIAARYFVFLYLQPSALRFTYSELVQRKQETVRRLCTYVLQDNSICYDKKLLGKITSESSRYKMFQIQTLAMRNISSGIPGPNSKTHPKVSSRQDVNWLKYITPWTAMRARKIIQEELPITLLNELKKGKAK